jgi:2',3'-cyclic-nucleotide 2'-phosphodiesterase/3'-nucleotidase
VFNRIDPTVTAPQPLLNPHVPSYVFDVIAGVTYQIDITQPARYGAHGKKREDAHRIVGLSYQGVPVGDGDEFVVVTNNYRTDSGGIVKNPADVVLRAPDQVRDVLVRYILAEKDIAVAAPEVWRFAPVGAPVEVTFESSPAAGRYLLAAGNVVSLGDAGDGFVTYGMTLG